MNMYPVSASSLLKFSAFAVLASLTATASFAADEKPVEAKIEKKAKAGKAPKKEAGSEAKVAFDPSVSLVKWAGEKVTGKHDGEIKLKSGELMMNGKEVKGGEFVLDMASITNADIKDPEYNKKLITHLKSDDFFNVEKFPTANLKIKKITSVEGFVGPTFKMVADLTIKGKTNEIEFPAVVDTKDGKTTATANITIDRTKWDIKYGSGKFFTGLGDKVINDDFKIDVALSTK